MDRFRRHLMLLTLFLVAFLIYASILSAFYGSARASAFFNSTAMVIFWVVLLAGLVASFFFFSPLRRSPGSLMVHLACILIIAGSMYGSRSCHELRHRFFGEQRIYDGYLLVHEKYSENRLLAEDESTILGELPFSVALQKFTIDYYPATRVLPAMARQYRSSALVLSPAGNKIGELRIAVNHPGVFGGYHFYQSSWGQDAYGPYSFIHVRAISGLYAVYAGYVLLCLGLVWSLWVKVVGPAMRKNRRGAADGN
jgi:hypothetical protein